MLLPIAPFTETPGTFVNAEGRVQSFHGVVKPLGEARPAWKVLRVLGNMLGLQGFEPTRRRARCWPRRCGAADARRAAWRRATVPSNSGQGRGAGARGLERIADVPIYQPTRSCAARPRCSSRPTPRAGVGLHRLRRAELAAGAHAVPSRQGGAMPPGTIRRSPTACASPPPPTAARRDVRPVDVAMSRPMLDIGTGSAAPGRWLWTLIKIVAWCCP